MKEKLSQLHSRIWNRKTKMIVKLVRWILTAQLIFLLHRETGPWTAAEMILVALLVEIVAWTLDETRKALAMLTMIVAELQEDYKKRKQGRFKKALKEKRA